MCDVPRTQAAAGPVYRDMRELTHLLPPHSPCKGDTSRRTERPRICSYTQQVPDTWLDGSDHHNLVRNLLEVVFVPANWVYPLAHSHYSRRGGLFFFDGVLPYEYYTPRLARYNARNLLNAAAN